MDRSVVVTGPSKTADWDTIDWVHEEENHYQYKSLKREQRQQHGECKIWTDAILEKMIGWLPVIIVGGVVGILAGIVDMASALLSSLRFGYCDTLLNSRELCTGQFTSWETVGGSEFIIFAFLTVLFGCIATLLVVNFAPKSAGSGIPEIKTILSGINMPDCLSISTLLIKCIGLSFSVGAGLSLGKEGPFVHVAACVGNLTSDLFVKYRYHESKRRETLSAACSAGVAVAFGAPIGGVLFSLEEVSYYFPHKTMWKSLCCAIVASLVLKRIDPSNSGSLIMFKLNYSHQIHWFEIVPLSVLGVVGGIIGSIFNYCNVKWMKAKRRLPINPLYEVAIVALLTAILNWKVLYLREAATDFLPKLFEQCTPSSTSELCDFESTHVMISLMTAAIVKLFLTIFTFGIKVPAGLFVPSLFVGACCGRLLGMAVRSLRIENSYWFRECEGIPASFCVIPGVYAVVGAASVLGGVTRMTLSLVVIVFELTGGLEYLVPVMIAVLISKWVGDWIGGKLSIYEMHIVLNGYPYLDPKWESNSIMTMGDLLIPQPIIHLENGIRVCEVTSILESCDYKGFPILDDDKHVVGWIPRKCLVYGIDRARSLDSAIGSSTELLFTKSDDFIATNKLIDLSWFTDTNPLLITSGTPVNRVLQLFKSLGLRSICVTSQSLLIGVVTRKDLLQYLSMEESAELPSPLPEGHSGSLSSLGSRNVRVAGR